MFPRKPNPVPTPPASVTQAAVLTGPGLTAGVAVGAAAGAVAGSFVPVVGTIIGGVTGALIVGTFGAIAGNRLGYLLDTRLLNKRIAEEQTAATKRSIETEVEYEDKKIGEVTEAYFKRLPKETPFSRDVYAAIWKKLDVAIKEEKISKIEAELFATHLLLLQARENKNESLIKKLLAKLNADLENRKKELMEERRERPPVVENLDSLAFDVFNEKTAPKPSDQIEFMIDLYISTPLSAIAEEYALMDQLPLADAIEKSNKPSSKLVKLYEEKKGYENDLSSLLIEYQSLLKSPKHNDTHALEHLRKTIETVSNMMGELEAEIKREKTAAHQAVSNNEEEMGKGKEVDRSDREEEDREEHLMSAKGKEQKYAASAALLFKSHEQREVESETKKEKQDKSSRFHPGPSSSGSGGK